MAPGFSTGTSKRTKPLCQDDPLQYSPLSKLRMTSRIPATPTRWRASPETSTSPLTSAPSAGVSTVVRGEVNAHATAGTAISATSTPTNAISFGDGNRIVMNRLPSQIERALVANCRAKVPGIPNFGDHIYQQRHHALVRRSHQPRTTVVRWLRLKRSFLSICGATMRRYSTRWRPPTSRSLARYRPS